MGKTAERHSGTFKAFMFIGFIMATILSSTAMSMAGVMDPKLQEQMDGLLQNAEDMVAHGGMGDAKAILHHCGEASRYAESIIKQLPASHPGREEAVASLTDVIRQCKRVAEIGIHADPGVLLNPAIKARSAARASVKALRVAG
ncbi:MAG TPA: hypothetical protein VLE46_14680 [Nitrospira sp.]|nr:hypothetical protein [Nitrospira sp.]